MKANAATAAIHSSFVLCAGNERWPNVQRANIKIGWIFYISTIAFVFQFQFFDSAHFIGAFDSCFDFRRRTIVNLSFVISFSAPTWIHHWYFGIFLHLFLALIFHFDCSTVELCDLLCSSGATVEPAAASSFLFNYRAQCARFDFWRSISTWPLLICLRLSLSAFVARFHIVRILFRLTHSAWKCVPSLFLQWQLKPTTVCIHLHLRVRRCESADEWRFYHSNERTNEMNRYESTVSHSLAHSASTSIFIRFVRNMLNMHVVPTQFSQLILFRFVFGMPFRFPLFECIAVQQFQRYD